MLLFHIAPRLSDALKNSVKKMERAHDEISTMYAQGLVTGYTKEYLHRASKQKG